MEHQLAPLRNKAPPSSSTPTIALLPPRVTPLHHQQHPIFALPPQGGGSSGRRSGGREMGAIGVEYQHNLRRTILNHTKEMFRPIRKHNSLHATLAQPDSCEVDSRDPSAQRTLSLLRKAMLREDRIDKGTTITLTASRLPIIAKKSRRRSKRVLGYDGRGFGQPISPPQPAPPQPRPPCNKEKPYLSGWEMEEGWL